MAEHMNNFIHFFDLVHACFTEQYEVICKKKKKKKESAGPPLAKNNGDQQPLRTTSSIKCPSLSMQSTNK